MKPLASALHHSVKYGDFDLFLFPNSHGEEAHVVLVKGEIPSGSVYCRISSECLPGTVLDSAECDCKEQIDFSLEWFSKENAGIFIYLRQEGRGIGLINKVLALENKNKGMDTFEAVNNLGFPDDSRCFNDACEILRYFNIESVRLLTNNPLKEESLISEGINVSETIRIPVTANVHSHKHLIAKADRGHSIEFTQDKIRKAHDSRN